MFVVVEGYGVVEWLLRACGCGAVAVVVRARAGV
jgi:hypothetical protein